MCVVLLGNDAAVDNSRWSDARHSVQSECRCECECVSE